MNYGKMIESYFYDLNNLTDLLTKLISSYKLLVSAAEETNRVALAKKGNVKNAIDRAESLGKIIDRIIAALEDETDIYIACARGRRDYINSNFTFNELIKNEMEERLKHSGD